MVKKMNLKKREIIDRPENEKKFSLKNPEDRAILIFLPIVIVLIIGIILFLAYIGGFLSPDNGISSLNSIGGSLWLEKI